LIATAGNSYCTQLELLPDLVIYVLLRSYPDALF